MSFITVFKYDVSIELEMEDYLLDEVILLELAFFVGKLGHVMRGLGVVGVQGFNDLFLLFFLCQLLLVNASHSIVLVHVDKIVIIFKVFTGFFFHHGFLPLVCMFDLLKKRNLLQLA